MHDNRRTLLLFLLLELATSRAGQLGFLLPAQSSVWPSGPQLRLALELPDELTLDIGLARAHQICVRPSWYPRGDDVFCFLSTGAGLEGTPYRSGTTLRPALSPPAGVHSVVAWLARLPPHATPAAPNVSYAEDQVLMLASTSFLVLPPTAPFAAVPSCPRADLGPLPSFRLPLTADGTAASRVALTDSAEPERFVEVTAAHVWALLTGGAALELFVEPGESDPVMAELELRDVLAWRLSTACTSKLFEGFDHHFVSMSLPCSMRRTRWTYMEGFGLEEFNAKPFSNFGQFDHFLRPQVAGTCAQAVDADEGCPDRALRAIFEAVVHECGGGSAPPPVLPADVLHFEVASDAMLSPNFFHWMLGEFLPVMAVVAAHRPRRIVLHCSGRAHGCDRSRNPLYAFYGEVAARVEGLAIEIVPAANSTAARLPLWDYTCNGADRFALRAAARFVRRLAVVSAEGEEPRQAEASGELRMVFQLRPNDVEDEGAVEKLSAYYDAAYDGAFLERHAQRGVPGLAAFAAEFVAETAGSVGVGSVMSVVDHGPLFDQIAPYLGSVDTLVMGHGAGMLHACWLKPGARVIEIVDTEKAAEVNGAAQGMARICELFGLVHVVLVCDPAESLANRGGRCHRMLLEALGADRGGAVAGASGDPAAAHPHWVVDVDMDAPPRPWLSESQPRNALRWEFGVRDVHRHTARAYAASPSGVTRVQLEEA